MENKENETHPKNLSLNISERPKPPTYSRIIQSAVKMPVFPMIMDYQKELQKLEVESKRKLEFRSFLENTNAENTKTETEIEGEFTNEEDANINDLSLVVQNQDEEGNSISLYNSIGTEDEKSSVEGEHHTEKEDAVGGNSFSLNLSLRHSNSDECGSSFSLLPGKDIETKNSFSLDHKREINFSLVHLNSDQGANSLSMLRSKGIEGRNSFLSDHKKSIEGFPPVNECGENILLEPRKSIEEGNNSHHSNDSKDKYSTVLCDKKDKENKLNPHQQNVNGENGNNVSLPHCKSGNENSLKLDNVKSILENNEEFEISPEASSTRHKDTVHSMWRLKSELQTPIQRKSKFDYSSSSSSSNSNNSLDVPVIFSHKNSLDIKHDTDKPWFISNNHKSGMKTPGSVQTYNKGKETPHISTTHSLRAISESKAEFETPRFTSESSSKSSKEVKPTVRKSDEDLGATPLNFTTSNQQPRVQCTIDVSSFMKTRPPIKMRSVVRKSDEERVRRNSGLMNVSFKRLCVNDVDYIVLKQLGTGGSSVVYHCFDPKNQTECAIKSVNLNQEPNAVNGYINEVRTLQKLQHCKRVIKMHMYQILQEEKVMYVVLEKGGADLHSIMKDLTKRSEHLPLYIIIFYWVEMLHAVKEIHSNGVIHSDLKPANFLEASGKIKLIDFGISSCVQQDNTSVIKNIAMGTFSYISPEALCGNKSNNYDSPNFGKHKFKISYKSDVWSLGCILYQLVYRRTPFQHLINSAAKICTIIDPNHKIEYPQIKNIPDSMIQTIKDCLQYNIKSRPSIDELLSRYGQYYS